MGVNIRELPEVKQINLVFLATVFCSIVGGNILGLFEVAHIYRFLLSQIILVLPSAYYIYKSKVNIKELIRFRTISIGNIILLIIFAYLITPLLGLINAISMLFVKNVISTEVSLVSQNVPFSTALIVIALLPALLEETVYRGIFYNGYAKQNSLKAILLSAFLFGCLHMNFNQMLYAFCMGIIFVLVIEATDSIVSAMVIHFVINGSSLMMSYVQEMMQNIQLDEEAEVLGTLDISTGVLVTAIMMIFVWAVICTALAILVYIKIAKSNGRLEWIKSIFSFKTKLINKEDVGKEEVLVDHILIIGISLCIFMAILVEIV